jgi:hypothetical protein
VISCASFSSDVDRFFSEQETGAVRCHGITLAIRKGDVMKPIFGALAMVMLLGAATVPAQAACWETPWGWRCDHPHWWWHHHWGYWHHDW